MNKLHTVTIYFINGDSNCYKVYGVTSDQAIQNANKLLSYFGQVKTALLSYEGKAIRIK